MQGKLLRNRYEVIEQIGEGGMALVYKAKDALLNRFVAVKVLRPEFVTDEEFLDKFEKESQAAASLSHHNIVNVFDVGTDEDIHVIVMELIEGRTLKSHITEKKGFMKDDEIIDISMQVAMAIEHAHANQIIHRDIKPHNILISKDGLVKVADFGIARATTSATVVKTNEAMGSVHYASPEQSKGGVVDARSDIYSLGIMMFELATGRVPFEGETPINVALKHLKEDVISPSVINANISEPLEQIILRCVEKLPVDRYQTTIDLMDDLDHAKFNPDESLDFDSVDSSTRKLPRINENVGVNYTMNRRRTKKKDQIGIKPRALAITLVAALVVSFVVVMPFFMSALRAKNTPKEIEMPSIVGANVESAKTRLMDVGLKFKVIEERNDTEYDFGEIITQNPIQGEIIKEGFEVKVVVSKGPVKVRIPNLMNKDFVDAKLVIENNNLEIGDVEYIFDDLPKGLVLEQSPKSGETVVEKSIVNLVVSQGQEIKTVLMPSLQSKNIDEVKETLTILGLRIGSVDEAFHETIEAGLLIEQSVGVGRETKERTKVSVVMSKGVDPEMVVEEPTVPTEGATGDNVLKFDPITGEPLDTPVDIGGTGSTEPVEPATPAVETVRTQVFPLSFSNDSAVVKVVKVQAGQRLVVYEKVHNKSEEQASVAVNGSGTATVEVYFDGVLTHSSEVSFE